MTSSVAPAFATSQRVGNGVHCFAPHFWSAAEPTTAPGFAQFYGFVFDVAETSDSRSAFAKYAANFSTGQDEMYVTTFPGADLCG